MASGFPGGGREQGFYGGGGRLIGGPVGNDANRGNNMYRFQQQQMTGGLADPGAQIGYRRPDFLMIGKRSWPEFRSSSSLLPQQQGLVGGGELFLRSVKQRINGGYHNHSLSPISPLSSSIDLCSPSNNLSQDHSPSLSTASSTRYGVPLYPHHHRHHLQQPGPVSPITQKPISNPEMESSNKMMATLQELEKQLLDDDDNYNDDQIGGGEGDGDAVSAITSSEWSETFQNLISPNPNASITTGNNPTSTSTTATNNNCSTISPSPTSSSSSSCSSSKTPPLLPPPASTPQPVPAVKPAQPISEAATAIVDGKPEESAEILSRLAQIASPTGDPEHRLAFYMHHALRLRLSPGENPAQVAELYGSDHLAALHALYDLSPCFKFALLSSNLLILEAITSTIQETSRSGKKVVHIVDFDVGHGRQYMHLLRALADRALHALPSAGSPLELKITAVETELRNDDETTKRLERVRDTLMKLVEEKAAARFSLRFNWITLAVGKLTRESLSCDADDVLVANFAFRLHRVPDESVSTDNLRDELLRRVRAMRPRLVTLAEQELNANTAPFATRVGECAAYYGALLDSLELTRENPDRFQVEKALGRKVSNAVACEGRERVERCEVFGKWRARMGMAGFKAWPVGRSVAEFMRANLGIPARGGHPNFTVKVDNGGVCFGWMGRTLTVASAWR